jgi:PAS domain S-box-containing protein
VLVWAALIHYTPGATAALMVTAVIAIAGTSMGTGPFGAADAAGDLVLLQQFLGVSSLTVLLLAAVGDERQTETRARMEAAEALAASRLEELNSLYESAPIGLAFFSRDYRYLRVNGELAAINGVAADDHIGRTIRDVLSDQAPSVEPIIDRIFETGEAIRDLEVSGQTPQQPGKIRHWLAGFYPVPGTRGGIDAVGAWVIEISERKAAEEREILLAREVDHRAKNLLAVVQSIVQLTPGDDGPTVKASLIGRILALGRAHSLLSDARWDGVDLGRLVHEELAPFASADGAISAQGPSVTLRPAAAQSIGLVLHELATNAAKYGALSRPDGSLLVEWDYADGDKGRLVEIVWTESGGPPPKEPSGTGFGSNIIRASVERQLRGQVTREWRPEGLRCTLRIPIAELLGAAEG